MRNKDRNKNVELFRRVVLAGLMAMAIVSSRSAVADPGSPAAIEEGQSTVMQIVADKALGYIGVPYRFGGSTPQSGFDCSGLVNHVFRETLGVTLPRTSRQLATVGARVSREELRPGDLVFFNTRGTPNSHVGIYLGDGRFVHAPRARTLVRIDRLDDAGYEGRFEGARRLDPIVLLTTPLR